MLANASGALDIKVNGTGDATVSGVEAERGGSLTVTATGTNTVSGLKHKTGDGDIIVTTTGGTHTLGTIEYTTGSGDIEVKVSAGSMTLDTVTYGGIGNIELTSDGGTTEIKNVTYEGTTGNSTIKLSATGGTNNVSNIRYDGTAALTVDGAGMGAVKNITIKGDSSSANLSTGDNSNITLTGAGGGQEFTISNNAKLSGTNSLQGGTVNINGGYQTAGSLASKGSTLDTEWNLTAGTTKGSLELGGKKDTVNISGTNSTNSTFGLSSGDKVYKLIENKAGDAVFNIAGGRTVTINGTVTSAGNVYNLMKHDGAALRPGLISDTGTSGRTDTGVQVIQNIIGNEKDVVNVMHSKPTVSGTTYSYIANYTEFKGSYVTLANGNKAFIYKNTLYGGPGETLNAHVDMITTKSDGSATKGLKQLNLDTGLVNNRVALEIGTIDRNSTAYLDVADVKVGGYADLIVHGSSTTPYQNKINTITTSGMESRIWLDQATLKGDATAIGTNVLINGGGILTGFHDSGVNVYGTVTMKTGSVIRPFDTSLYDWDFMLNPRSSIAADSRTSGSIGAGKGVGFVIQKSVSGAVNDGDYIVDGNVDFDIRLFSGTNGMSGTVATQWDPNQPHSLDPARYQGVSYNESDFIKVVDGKAIFNSQATFSPRFGDDNELTTKQDFKVYKGDGIDTSNTYYYNFIRTTQQIVSNLPNTQPGDSGDINFRDSSKPLTGYNIMDNSLFNNRIIKSDMLGEWTFMTNYDPSNPANSGTDVILRFRLLAEHPTKGGIAIGMHEPNAAAAARQIDRIRYPFDHNVATRYDGDMNKEYGNQNAIDPGKYPNYDPKYIADFEDFLLNVQDIITSGANLNTAIRRIHPEPYAGLASVNIGLMDQFVRTREQHGISSLFQVESANYEAAVQAAAVASGDAYASVEGGYCADDDYYPQFVSNPIRFWAAGFGTDGKQKKIGTEYGYDTEVWGGALGVNKEWRDLYAGLSFAYGRVDTKWKELHASSKTDAYMVDALVGLRKGMGFFELYGNYGYHDQSMTRDINVSLYTGTARGEYHDNVYGGGFRMGYQMVLGCNWLFVPTIGVNYVKSESSAFTEKGRDHMSILLDFKKGDIKRQNVRVPITMRLNRSFALGCFVLTPEVRAGFTPIFGDKRSSATSRFVGDPSAGGYFTAIGPETGKYTADLGASIELSRQGRFHVSANYDYTFGKKQYYHNYSLLMGLNF